jgi:hypothetical protein
MSAARHKHVGRIGVSALAALLVVAVVVGCGESSSSSTGALTQTTTASSSATATTRAAGGATGTSKAASGAQPTSSVAKATTHASAPHVTHTVGGRVLRGFSGVGDTRLGTIAVSSPEVLVWTAQHGGIQIFTSNGFILVTSHAANGSVRLSRGAYRGARVATHAGWTIELRAPS